MEWQFAGPDPEKREKATLRVIAWSFFALAAYVTIAAALSLFGVREAEHSPVGIVLAAVSLMVMPFLSLAEQYAGRELGSATAVADSKQTLICSYLSGAIERSGEIGPVRFVRCHIPESLFKAHTVREDTAGLCSTFRVYARSQRVHVGS